MASPSSTSASSSTDASPLMVKARLKGSFVDIKCVYCSASLEYPSQEATEYTVVCCACNETFGIKVAAAKGKAKKRKIGTDERPLDLSFYEILGLTPTATQDEIKKAYRKMAIKYHPDKNINDPTAGEVFRDIAIAYATLSDIGLRHSYNEFGKGKGDGPSEETMVDPEAMFSQLFGGERFLDIIGTISLGTEMKKAMQNDDDDEDATPTTSTTVAKGSTALPLTPEEKAIKAAARAAKDAIQQKLDDEKARVREVRVKALVERLRNKISLFTEQASGEDDEVIASGVRTMWTIEAEELKDESYGAELLNTVGFVYSSKSSHFLSKTGIIPFGLGGWYFSARSTAHIVSETISTARSAYALKDVFDSLAAAESSGLPEEKRKELEEKAAALGLEALFKGAKLEVESIIREVCDRILSEDVSAADLRMRAVAIGILGAAFESVVPKSSSKLPGSTSPIGSKK